jgi:hypothetical protein
MNDEEAAEAVSERDRRTRAPRRARPPEVAAADIDRIFDANGIAKKAAPAKLDAAWSRSAGLPDAHIVLNWLNLAPEGVVDRALWNRVRLPTSRQTALAEQVRKAYAPVFDALDDLGTATKAQLDEAFVTAYDLGDTVRYVRAFGILCRQAGIAVQALSARAAGDEASQDAPARTAQPRPARRPMTASTPKTPPTKRVVAGSTEHV